MTREQIAALALGALAVFWMVGAYNRLVALRNAIGEAWAKVDDALRQRAGAGAVLETALREPLAAEQGTLDTWQASLAEAARSAAALTARPVSEDNAAAWIAAESALAGSTARVLALLDLNSALRDEHAVVSGTTTWHEASARLVFARQLFNDAALAYNEAIALFPTRLLLPLFRFGRCGRI